MAVIATLPWGYIRTLGDNELEIVSTKEDPPKIRLGAVAGGSLGCVSFNRIDAEGTHREVVLLQGKQRADLGGELWVGLKRPGPDYEDDDLIETVAVTHDSVTFFRGRFRLVNQRDGNLVLYIDGRPSSATFGVPAHKVW